MDKNWLIRTKSNHILGPVSKEKVQELYHNGSIKPDDEICSGNGFWFYIREEEMVSRFLIGGESQGFNPISEAKDVLTGVEKDALPVSSQKDDITVVGGVTLAMLAEESPVPEMPLPHHSEEIKKKTKPEKTVKPSVSLRPPAAPVKKQSYLKWVGLSGFIVILCLIYFRKRIIRGLFEGGAGITTFLVSEAIAEEISVEKKKLLDHSLTLDEVTFAQHVGLEGFRVVSSFSINNITCGDLANDVHQLGIILYPPELINEKFLIKMRQCVLNMPDQHPVKRWLKSIAVPAKLGQKEQETVAFLTEVLNSRMNLITDPEMRLKIVNHLVSVPEGGLGERVLKSYLYLIIGNIAKSDGLLQEFLVRPPYVNWQGFTLKGSLYRKLAEDNIDQILGKLARHPADRKVFQLFVQYLLHFYKSEPLSVKLRELQGNLMDEKLDLKYVERISPHLVRHLRLAQDAGEVRLKKLRELESYPLHEQAYWHWPFLDAPPSVSEELVSELRRIEKEDELWFIYLMDDEKLMDFYTKKTGKGFLQGRRYYLRSMLEEKDFFMLSLFKLIELGDIDGRLVSRTTDFLANE